jgi:hypothetical protein
MGTNDFPYFFGFILNKDRPDSDKHHYFLFGGTGGDLKLPFGIFGGPGRGMSNSSDKDTYGWWIVNGYGEEHPSEIQDIYKAVTVLLEFASGRKQYYVVFDYDNIFKLWKPKAYNQW